MAEEGHGTPPISPLSEAEYSVGRNMEVEVAQQQLTDLFGDYESLAKHLPSKFGGKELIDVSVPGTPEVTMEGRKNHFFANKKQRDGRSSSHSSSSKHRINVQPKISPLRDEETTSSNSSISHKLSAGNVIEEMLNLSSPLSKVKEEPKKPVHLDQKKHKDKRKKGPDGSSRPLPKKETLVTKDKTGQKSRTSDKTKDSAKMKPSQESVSRDSKSKHPESKPKQSIDLISIFGEDEEASTSSKGAAEKPRGSSRGPVEKPRSSSRGPVEKPRGSSRDPTSCDRTSGSAQAVQRKERREEKKRDVSEKLSVQTEAKKKELKELIEKTATLPQLLSPIPNEFPAVPFHSAPPSLLCRIKLDLLKDVPAPLTPLRDDPPKRKRRDPPQEPKTTLKRNIAVVHPQEQTESVVASKRIKMEEEPAVGGGGIDQLRIAPKVKESFEEELRSAEYYLMQRAKPIKHAADAVQSNWVSRMLLYLESIVFFVMAVRALEKELSETSSRPFSLIHETYDLLRQVTARFANHSQGLTFVNRIHVLSLRAQALLCYQLFDRKKTQAHANHQKIENLYRCSKSATSNGSSGRNSSAGQSGVGHGDSRTPTSVPSTPSPASSSCSVTPLPPGHVAVPHALEACYRQQLGILNNLMNAHRHKDESQAQPLTPEDAEFFAHLDKICGVVELESPLEDLCVYLNTAVRWLKDLVVSTTR